MKLTIDSKLNFGDTIYIVDLVNVDEFGELSTSNPVIREEKVTRIILGKNGTIDYNDETGHFKTLNEAKTFCEKHLFKTELEKSYDFEQVTFIWNEEPYIQEDNDEDMVKYILEAELPDTDKDGNRYID